MSIVDATQMRNQVLYGEWSSKWKSVLNAIGSLDDVDDFGQAIFGTWRPRQDMGNIDVLAEVSLAEMTGMRMGAPLKIVAIIDDVPDSRTDKYESDWNGFWHFVNVMQFNSTAVFLSKLGISKAIYSNLGTIIAEADAPEVALGTDVVVDEKWNDIMDDFIDDIAITCATEMHSRIHELETAGVEQKNICIVARTHKLLDSYIAGLQRAGIKSFEIKANKTDDRIFEGVRIATMHRVKGLEFDHVFAVAVNKKVLPFGTRSDFEDDISLEEFRTGEKCLLYVALTRARKSACVTCYGGLSELIV